jgi:hypothetical protein
MGSVVGWLVDWLVMIWYYIVVLKYENWWYVWFTTAWYRMNYW